MLLLIPVIAVAIPIWTVVLLTRAVTRLVGRKTVAWDQIIEPHAEKGWKPKPNLNCECSFAAGVFRARTGEDGWPAGRSLDEAEMVVFGDSFASGFGVDHGRAFFSLRSGIRIKAIGSPGYSMVQELLWMKWLAPSLSGKTVVWFLYFGNDLYDNLLPNLYHYRMPFARRGKNGWEVVTSHVSPARWPYNPEKNFREEEKFRGAFGENPLSTRVYEACEYLIGEGRDVCSRANADLVLLSIPWTVQLDDAEWSRRCKLYGQPEDFDRHAPDRRIGEIAQRLGVPLVEGRRCWSAAHHFPNEGHWNEGGHRRVAELLEQIHRNRTQPGRSGVRPAEHLAVLAAKAPLGATGE
jgi:hypothetical protein